MANEIQVRCSIDINNAPLRYKPPATSFLADQEGLGGPTPGQLTIPVAGYVDVDLSILTVPGIVRIQNLDSAEIVQYGVNELYFGEVLPGEFYLFRLSRYFSQQVSGTGTSGVGSLRVWGAEGTKVLVEAFEA